MTRSRRSVPATTLGLSGGDVHRRAVASLFELFDHLCEGALAVDREARIVWINAKYQALLGVPEDQPVLGREVEDIIPESLMRHVVTTGRPILLDIMRFGTRHFVVTRLPLVDDDGRVSGAVGFVLYDRLDHLKPILSKFKRLQAELTKAQEALVAARRAKYSFSQFIGTSPAIAEVKRRARCAASADSPVLLLGETGTGKELLAQAIHGASARSARPFVAVNVAAVPETLLEAEFFGTAPGAYTGADRREGKFKLADGGTLFLDEIGDMPLHLQAKLLRALQEKEIEALGSNKVMQVDVRVIAATSVDLYHRVEEGSFRPDLFYRLDVLPIEIPPLRARLGDIPPLVEVILEDLTLSRGLPPRELTAEATALLMGHDWPGNVRELRNVLERACLLTDDPVLEPRHLRALLPDTTEPARPTGIRPLAEAVAELERSAIQAAMQATGGRKLPAARLLGISRSQLYKKLNDYGLSEDETELSESRTAP